MKYLTNRSNTIVAVLLVLLLGVSFSTSAQVPTKPNPPRLVSDFAGVFTPQQVSVLEDSLVRFAKRTSNQVTIVTLSDLGGMEPSQMAYEIGEQWGVGGKKNNNGVVILIKPKNDTKGEAYIATGYGVEGALPDGACGTIIRREMLPAFKNNDYYGGVANALNVILPVLAQEYSIQEYENEDLGMAFKGFGVAIIAMIFVFIIIFLIDRDNKNNNSKNGNSGTFGGGRSGTEDIASAILLGSLLGGSSGRSGGSFGGGFGGFGGGSFGGGGAGGSW